MGRADGRAALLPAGDDVQGDAAGGQHDAERFIICARRGGERLVADIAAGEIQRACDAGEQRRVELRVRAGDELVVLEEVRRERRGGDHVAAGGDDGHVGVFCSRGLHHRQTVGKGHEAPVLAEHKQHHARVFPGRPLQQIRVAVGERVAVHDQRRAGRIEAALGQLRGELAQVAVKAVAAVLHEHETAVHARDLVKAARGKELRAVALGVQEQVRVAALHLHLHQMRHDVGHEALAAVRGGDGHAAQRVFKDGAGGEHLAVVRKDAGGIGEVSVAHDALGAQQRVHLRLRALVAGGNFAGKVFAHGAS